MNDLDVVLASLRARRLSTAITGGSVAVAVALLLTMLSLRKSGFEAFQRGSGTTHLLVSADTSPLVAVLNGVFYANPPSNPVSWEKFNEIRSSFPFEWAIPTQQGDSFRGFPVCATAPEFFTKFQPVRGEPWSLSEGRFPEGNFEICMGSAAAAGTGLRVGQQVRLTHGAGSDHGHEHAEYPYTVVGILQPTGSAHDRAVFTDLESSWILHAHDRRERDGIEGRTVAAHLVDADRKITGVLLRLPTRPGSDASAAIQQQFDRLRRDTSITVAQPAQQIDRLRGIVGDIDGLFIALGVAVLVSSGISILLALYNSMAERRRQIAVLRAIGLSRTRVQGMVVAEACLIGLAGGIAGIALSALGGSIAAAALKARIGLVVNPEIDLRAAIVVLAASVVLAGIASVLPALLAYRTPVADNLRPAA
jgi:putative ABC transport system permease protein